MQFVNEEWVITWQQEYRALRGCVNRGFLAVAAGLLLVALWSARREPAQAGQLEVGLMWMFSLLCDKRDNHSRVCPSLRRRLRAAACYALLLLGLALVLQTAFFAVALSAGIPLTAPLQALVSHNPELAWPAVADRTAPVLSPASLGHAFGMVPFTCVGLLARLIGQAPKPRPITLAAKALVIVIMIFAGLAPVVKATCVAIYRSPLAAVAGGLLLIAAFALLTALLGRPWEVPASAKPAEAEA